MARTDLKNHSHVNWLEHPSRKIRKRHFLAKVKEYLDTNFDVCTHTNSLIH